MSLQSLINAIHKRNHNVGTEMADYVGTGMPYDVNTEILDDVIEIKYATGKPEFWYVHLSDW